ncbi:MAG: D-alanyl-D-alanine carboxypeptidase/D-alanyl-D-alanine endopeptidase [Longimicrobiales bacterium]
MAAGVIRAGFLILLLTIVTAAPIRPDPALAAQAGFSPLAATPAAAAPHAALALRADIERLVATPGRWSVTVVSLDRGDTLIAHSPDIPLVPASNMKLFTSAAALYYLGPQYRYNTFLLADGTIQGGVLQGDLIIYGTGDPTISDRFGQKMRVWETFADTLIALGVREIRGKIVADASYFGGPGTAAGWEKDYMNASYAAPASALSFAENVATLQVKPAAETGGRPEVRLIPGGEGSIAVVNEATTVAGRRSWINVTRTSYDGPILIRGQIGKNTMGVLRTVPVSDPARWAGAVLRETLEKRGLHVTGGVVAVQSPEASPVTGRLVFAPAFSDKPPLRVLAIHESPPLFDILEVVNKKSHNLLAEQTLRTVGRVALGQGTVEAGARAVRHLLEAEASGVTPDITIYDGSGLSILNRVTTRSVIHLLSFMAKSNMWNDYWETLPEAGNGDGLRRMYRTPADHNLRAKTGTIDHVSALSGYVRAANGERLAFSIISNDVPSTYRAKRIEDAIGARLATFDRAAEEGTGAVAPTPNAPRPATVRAAAPQTASRAARSYVIRKGDTFDGIARRNGITVNALRRANPGLNPRRLIPGRRITLPR